MPRITTSVMLSSLTGSLDDRVRTAARAGLQSVQLRAEYANWSDADFTRFRKLTRSYNLAIDAIAAGPNLAPAIAAAQKLDCPQIILAAPTAPDLADKANLTLLVEPKGAALPALQLVKSTDSPRLRLLFDVSTEQAHSGDLTRTLSDVIPYTNVIRVAATPVEINWRHIYRTIAKSTFSGTLVFTHVPSLTQAVNDFRNAAMEPPPV